MTIIIMYLEKIQYQMKHADHSIFFTILFPYFKGIYQLKIVNSLSLDFYAFILLAQILFPPLWVYIAYFD